MVPLATANLGELERTKLLKVFDSGWIGAGSSAVSDLELDFAQYFQSRALLVANGSVALVLALKAAGVRPGDEVIVPAFTYAASASSVIHVGAKPVFCDVDLDTWQLSLESAQEAASARTRAIILPHLYGVPADLGPIHAFARDKGYVLIEDAAESFGAKYKERFVGTVGDIGTFSFFPNKLLTSGEGGLCITTNPELYGRMRLLRGQGMSETLRYVFDEPGYNFRMTGLQAAVLSGQIERFEQLWKCRSESENRWQAQLENLVLRPDAQYEFTRSPWIYSCRLPGIDITAKRELAANLASQGIETRPVFYSLPEMPAFSDCLTLPTPNAATLSREGISLPTGSHVAPQVYEDVAKQIRKTNAKG